MDVFILACLGIIAGLFVILVLAMVYHLSRPYVIRPVTAKAATSAPTTFARPVTAVDIASVVPGQTIWVRTQDARYAFVLTDHALRTFEVERIGTSRQGRQLRTRFTAIFHGTTMPFWGQQADCFIPGGNLSFLEVGRKAFVTYTTTVVSVFVDVPVQQAS